MKLSVVKTFKKVFIVFFSGLIACSCLINEPSKPYDYTVVDDDDLENMESLQFAQILGNGINLGNTFETNGANYHGFNAKPSAYETFWGQPITTKELFKAYKAAGFDSVRIPVAWTSTMDWRNNDYKINNDFMERIKEVVNYALEADLIVMINDHWDYQWWGLFGQDLEKAYKVFDAIWDQVGTEFKDYPYQLFFEAGNEEWGHRFNDEVDGKTGNLTLDEQYELITELAQHFVDKIRNQGSKNEKRFLLIPGYNTDFEKTCDSRYKMPEDPTNSVNKLLISVHYYSPALYSLVDEPVDWGGIKQPATTWGTAAEVKAQNDLFKMMKNFSDKGYGVIIGEYAVAKLKVSNNEYKRKDNDTVWLTNVLDNCDEYGYAPFLWDCNGYFSKGVDEDGKPRPIGFVDEDIAAIYKNRNYASEKPTDIADKKLSVSTAESGIAEYSINIPFKAGDQIKISASFSGASNFKQIGLQTSADSDWHQAWEDGGFTDNYVYTETITANSDGNTIQFKYIIQQPINPDSSPSEITISKVKVTVNK